MRKNRSWDTKRQPSESSAEYVLRMLIMDLQLLASDSEALIRHYYPPDDVIRQHARPEANIAYEWKEYAADDLANDFDTRLEMVEQSGARRLISPEMLEKIRVVNAKLGEMSGLHDEELWTDAALHTRAEWKEIRNLAKEALDAMGQKPESPPPWRGRIVPAR